MNPHPALLPDLLTWEQDYAGFALLKGWNLTVRGGTWYLVADNTAPKSYSFRSAHELWNWVVDHVDRPECRFAIDCIARHCPQSLVVAARLYGFEKQTKSDWLRVLLITCELRETA